MSISLTPYRRGSDETAAITRDDDLETDDDQLTAQRADSARIDQRWGCPLASNCSCIFSRGPVSTDENTAVHSPVVAAEVTKWTDRGWRVTSATRDDVILERTRALPFCGSLFLTVATGFLWLLYWLPRSRHPKTDVKTVTLAADGTARTVTRRTKTATDRITSPGATAALLE